MEKQLSHVEVLVPNGERSSPQVLTDNLPTWKSSYTQITGACIVHLLTIQAGVNMAFAAILVSRLQEPDSDIKITDTEGAWIASLVTISLPIGSLMSGPLMDRYGRKNLSLFLCIPYLISWILIYWSYNVVWLYAGRVIAGAAGGISTVSIFYTAETANPLWRPMLLGLNSVFVSLGILLTSVFGLWFHWRTDSVIFAVLTAVIFFFVATIPESPHWLLSFGGGTQDLNRVVEARKSIRWFNRRESQAEKEFNQLLVTYRNHTGASPKQNETLREKIKSLKAPEIYKPIVLLFFIFFFQQCTGCYVIIFYAVDLFKELGGNFGFFDEYGAMVAMGLLRFIMAVVTLYLSRRYGRKTLCIISGIGMGISMLSASVYMHVNGSGNMMPTLLLVLLYVCFGTIGWQTIPWTLPGEMLPTRVRAIVGGILISYTYLWMFIVVQTYPILKGLILVKGVFLAYSIFSFVSALFVWKYQPETYGKTLVEIERYYKN